MKPSQKQVSRLKNIKNKKLSTKKLLKLKSKSIKKKSKKKQESTKKQNQQNPSKTSNTINIKENEYTNTIQYKPKIPEFVIEPINVNTGTTLAGEKIDRTNLEIHFLPSSNIDKNKQHTWSTYLNSMFLGYSPGHNAPAGNHKTNQSTYLKTFSINKYVSSRNGIQ